MAALFLNVRSASGSTAWRRCGGRAGGSKRACCAFSGGSARRLEPRSASAFGRRFLRAVGPLVGKGAHVERNLTLAFPDLSASAHAGSAP